MEKRLENHKVAVLCGGLSAEREVSLRSGENVYQALRESGVSCCKIDVDRDFAASLKESGATVAYIALHGQYGEDGAVQGMLELLGIPYTGSGVLASSLGMDKVATKRMLRAEGLLTPDWVCVQRGDVLDVEAVAGTIGFPLIVKSVAEGSSINVAIVKDAVELKSAAEGVIEKTGSVLIEAFRRGVEVTTGVLGSGCDAVALPVLELVSQNEFYDYEAKYTEGMTEFVLPARLEKAVYAAVQRQAVLVHQLVGCRGVSRVDAIVEPDGEVWTIEINTSPGMTNTSDLPAQAAEAGIPFAQLVLRILEDGLRRYDGK